MHFYRISRALSGSGFRRASGGTRGREAGGSHPDPRERRRRRRAEPRETRAPEAAPGGRIKKGRRVAPTTALPRSGALEESEREATAAVAARRRSASDRRAGHRAARTRARRLRRDTNARERCERAPPESLFLR